MGRWNIKTFLMYRNLDPSLIFTIWLCSLVYNYMLWRVYCTGVMVPQEKVSKTIAVCVSQKRCPTPVQNMAQSLMRRP